jgi:hypothetical protein
VALEGSTYGHTGVTPTTGTTIQEDFDRSPISSATKVKARTTFHVVTPNSLKGYQRSAPIFTAHINKMPFGVENALFPEYLCNDGNGGIEEVEDDENECVGCCLGNTSG